MNTSDRYAVIGQPIQHSKSPRIHRLFAEQTGQLIDYSAKEVAPENFSKQVDDFFATGGKGLNCTVPLKELAFIYAGQKTARALRAKAVNTLLLDNNGIVQGDNTDGGGLVTDLTANHGIDLAGKSILILGAGGASRGILAPILNLQPQRLVLANRTFSKAESLVAEFTDFPALKASSFTELSGQQFDLIINATSTSLSNQLPPLPPHILAKNGCCYDLAYSNQATTFVCWGQEQGALKSLDGLGMLVEQAAEAFFLWRGVRPKSLPVIELLNAERY